jgi:hypothetical protein
MLVKRLLNIEVSKRTRVRNFLLVLLFIAPTVLSAQSISVVSFKKLESGQNTDVSQSILDRNGDVCAVIKIVTLEKGFSFEGDMLGIEAIQKKSNGYWIFIPQSAKSLSIMHLTYGVLQNYDYPVPIRKEGVYEMQIITTTKNEDNIVYIPKWNFIKRYQTKT